ncbi:MAG: MATE family efflux transporter [Hydrogeniiclostridium mannosilyticum]
MAGNTAAGNIEGFVYTSMNALYQASLSFTSQNVGAKKLNRVVPVLVRCLGAVVVVGAALSSLAILLSRQLLGIYSSDPAVIQYGVGRLEVVCATYFLCGMMDVACGSMRGLGSSIIPTVVSLCLRAADFVDIHHLRCRPHAVLPIPFLPHYLDNYFCLSPDMLPDFPVR